MYEKVLILMSLIYTYEHEFGGELTTEDEVEAMKQYLLGHHKGLSLDEVETQLDIDFKEVVKHYKENVIMEVLDEQG